MGTLVDKVYELWLNFMHYFSSPERVVILPDAHATRLSTLAKRFGSDKAGQDDARFAWKPHNYDRIYELLFQRVRLRVTKVLEIGIGSNDTTLPSSMGVLGSPGASLRMWAEFFPNAEVFGFDIDPKTLFSEDRIQTGLADQLKPASLKQSFEAFEDRSFDLVIDDGHHSLESQIFTLEAAARLLAPDGVYVVEDVSSEQVVPLRKFAKSLGFNVSHVQLRRNGLPLGNNQLLLITRQDSA